VALGWAWPPRSASSPSRRAGRTQRRFRVGRDFRVEPPRRDRTRPTPVTGRIPDRGLANTARGAIIGSCRSGRVGHQRFEGGVRHDRAQCRAGGVADRHRARVGDQASGARKPLDGDARSTTAPGRAVSRDREMTSRLACGGNDAVRPRECRRARSTTFRE